VRGLLTREGTAFRQLFAVNW